MSDSTNRPSDIESEAGVSSTVMYTIGHGNARPEEIIALLREHRIEVLVDVRSTPYSRYAFAFNREQLRDSLARAGIDYSYAGEHIGGRPNDPTCYLNGQLPPADSDFLHLIDYAEIARRSWFRRGLARLIEIAAARPTVVMCSEEDPSRCHRHHLIARNAIAAGLVVRHIRHSRGQTWIENAEQLKAHLPSTEGERAEQLSLFGDVT
jgi:uncharacterized protein (DUF488 family)